MKEKVLLWGYSSHSAAHGLPGQPLKSGWPQGAGRRVQPAVEVDDCWASGGSWRLYDSNIG